MAGGHPVGLVYVEVAMDYTPYTRAQKNLLKSVQSTTLNVEKSYTDLGIKSAKTFDLMRAKIHNAYNRIANDAKSSAQDIIRAEQAKNAKLKQLNDQQFGAQTSLISKLKKNWMAYSVAIYAVQRSLRAVRTEFKDFESALVDMGKVTDRPLALIRKDIMSIDPVLGDATSLVKGYYQTISAGVTDPVKALDLLTTAAKAASAAHVDQSEVIKALTKMMAGFSGEVKTAADAADLLFRIEKLGQTSVSELVPIIGDISTASREAGVSQYEMAAAMSQITLTAGGTSEAATQYKSILMGLMKPNEKLTELIKNLGFTTSVAMVKQIGLANALQKIRGEADRTGVQIGKLFRSSEGMLGLAALSVDGFEEYRQKIEEVREGAGGAETAFNSWTLTAEALDKELDANFKRLMVELGGAIMPTMNEAVKGLNAAMPTLSSAINTATQNFAQFWQAIGLATTGIISWKDALLGGDGATDALMRFNMELGKTAKIFKINEETKGWDIYNTPEPKPIKKKVGVVVTADVDTSSAKDTIKKEYDDLMKEVEKAQAEFAKTLPADSKIITGLSTSEMMESQIKALNDQSKAYAEITKADAEKTKEVLEEMYSDLKFQSDGYYDYRRTQLEQQAADYEKYTGDAVLAHKWLVEQIKALDEERLDASKSTNQFLMDMSERTAEAIEDNFSKFYRDVFRGELDSAADYFRAFCNSLSDSFSDMLGQMTKEMLFGGGSSGGGGLFKSLFSGIGGLFKGGKGTTNKRELATKTQTAALKEQSTAVKTLTSGYASFEENATGGMEDLTTSTSVVKKITDVFANDRIVSSQTYIPLITTENNKLMQQRVIVSQLTAEYRALGIQCQLTQRQCGGQQQPGQQKSSLEGLLGGGGQQQQASEEYKTPSEKAWSYAKTAWEWISKMGKTLYGWLEKGFDLIGKGFGSIMKLLKKIPIIGNAISKVGELLMKIPGVSYIGKFLGKLPLVGGLFSGGGSSAASATYNAADWAATLWHGGGEVGVSPTSYRSVSSSIFEGAPRLHDGLLSDEYPAILKKHEIVFTPKQLEDMKNAVIGDTVKQLSSLETALPSSVKPVSNTKSVTINNHLTVEGNMSERAASLHLNEMEEISRKVIREEMR